MSMGTKLLTIFGIIGAVIFTYILMLAMQPSTNILIVTANASTSNWTAATGFQMAQGVMNSYPLWQWFIPGFVGLFSIVVVWRG